MEVLRYMISDAAKKIDVEPHVLRYWEEELAVDIPRNEMGHRYYREEDIEMMSGVKYLKEKGFQLKSIRILLPEITRVKKLETRRLLELRDRLDLAVSQEELRLQREQELRECGAAAAEEPSEEQAGTELQAGSAVSGARKKPFSAESALAAENRSSGEEPAERAELSRPAAEAGVLQQEDKMQRFRSIMNEIIMEAMQENNKQLTGSITESVSHEFAYQMKRKEQLAEEHFKQLDRVLREYQQGQKQAAVARECSGGRRKSKFFRKNGKVRI